MSEFSHFGSAVNTKFEHLAGKTETLFVSTVTGDQLWDAYLQAFPEGTNPIYRERTEHDCSCCKNFIRNIGIVIHVNDDNSFDTVWNVAGELEYPYNVVAKTLHELIVNSSIRTVFYSKEPSYGSKHSIELLADGTTHKWNHFWAKVPSKFITGRVAELRSVEESAYGVFKRALDEFNLESIDQVLGLIQENALYRGEEHKNVVVQFRKLFVGQPIGCNITYAWKNAGDFSARIRNTVIGTLITDLSNGVDLEDAVRMFESKVAPVNYKRPKALITKKMVDDATAKIRELDLESSLQRRHAKLSDVSVNNVLWVDNAIQHKMKDGLKDILMTEVKPTKKGKVEGIPIDIQTFMKDVVPNAVSMRVQMKSELIPNLMSITAPVDVDSNQMFKWNNGFGWSYNGNIADSDIKQRVKAAGGNVTNAQLRVSLSWFNTDDLDIHIQKNGSRSEIYFGNRRAWGGVLDVDMNVGGETREPVENVSWVNVEDGVYKIKVHNYRRRESIDTGFVIEIENNGDINQYTYTKPVGQNETVNVGSITVKNGIIIDAKIEISKGNMIAGKEVWGIKCNELVSVQTLMYSPNHWDDNEVGNKHYFFILEGCLNDEPTRGMYNEFLKSELEPHRKVFEILGDKLKCEVASEQLSGVGFSSTMKDRTVMISVVDQNSTKMYNVSFA